MEARLSPHAAQRIARESATQSFDNAARAINLDWGTSYDGKQMQRISEALGRTLVNKRQAEMWACERGDRPRGPASDPALLVIEMDGGRVQSREKNTETGSRWREDKVLTISSYLPGDGGEHPPEKIVTTYLATMGDADALAGWRGWRPSAGGFVRRSRRSNWATGPVGSIRSIKSTSPAVRASWITTTPPSICTSRRGRRAGRMRRRPRRYPIR